MEPAPAPPLDGDVEADVAIVGGGYTGLWTALALKEREPRLRVVVLEAEECGVGPSGRNGGFVHGYWSYLPRLRERFGDEGALAVGRAGALIVPGIRAFCEQHGADVWLREARDDPRLDHSRPGRDGRRGGPGGAGGRRSRRRP